MNKLNLVAALTFTLAVPAVAGADDGPDPADVLGKLHHANQMEIEAGKLAQEKGDSKQVKAYGKTLVKDHTAADKKVMATAKQLKVELPKDMPPMKDDKMEEAKAATGPDFDKKFAEAMLDDHKKDVEETSEARDKTTNPKLKKLLAGLVPTLEKHRDTAQKLVDGAEKK
jgi:putative membrane protein